MELGEINIKRYKKEYCRLMGKDIRTFNKRKDLIEIKTVLKSGKEVVCGIITEDDLLRQLSKKFYIIIKGDEKR